jgi:hypothetical protein
MGQSEVNALYPDEEAARLEPVESQASATRWLPWLGIGLLSAVLRLYQLGAAPLSPAEAGEALGALAGSGAAGSPSSGFLAAANSFLFWLIGPSDVSARLLPALVGTFLPLAMLLFARREGRRGALIAAALLALSPSLTLFSRSASAVGLGCAAMLVLLGALFRGSEQPGGHPAWLGLAGAALGLGVASGGAFLSLALTLFVAVLVVRPGQLVAAARNLLTRRPLLMAVASLILGGTFLFFFPDGLGITADGLTVWLNGFSLSWGGRSLGILLVYELLILLFGLLGLALGLWRGDSFSKIWSAWALAGLALVLVRPDQPDAPFVLLIPLALLGGMVLDAILPRQRNGWNPLATYGSAVVLVALGVHIFISLGQYGRQITYNSERATASLLLAGISGILVVGVVALIWTYSRIEALRGFTVAVVVLLALYGWGRAWELGHDHQADPRELWVDEATGPGARILVDTLRTTSERAARASYTLPVTVGSHDPVLRWYLRDFSDVAWVDSLQPGIVTEAVVAPEEEGSPLLGSSYLGMDLDLRLTSPAEKSGTLSAALRWLLLRDLAAGGEPVASSRVVVWIRQDVSLLGQGLPVP